MDKIGSQANSRLLMLLEHIVNDQGVTPVAVLAADLGLAPSTARRLLASLLARGLITRVARGRYSGGERLMHLAANIIPHHRVIEVARPLLKELARTVGGTAHMGVLDQDMVTYLVKEGERAVFTRERGQLEAYCTGIGKALLAELPPERFEAYLQVPFVRLTQQTITDPAALRSEVRAIRSRGYAIDDREMADDLTCVAVPVGLDGDIAFAISVSGDPARMADVTHLKIAARLTKCSEQIRQRVTGSKETCRSNGVVAGLQ